MANIDLKFLCTCNDKDYIKCRLSNQTSELIYIELHQEGKSNVVMLDKSTAIKFAKTLRTEINKIKEVYNG